MTTPPQTILVIDDDPVMRELLFALLTTEGHSAIVAASGPEALAQLETLPPHSVILVDLHMPGLQGAELVQQLRAAAQPETRIIAMSASAPPVTPATPWDAFLLKPFSVDDFHHVLTSTQLHEFTTESHSNTILDDTIFTRLASMIPAAQLRELYKITLADVQNRLQRMQSATTAGDLDTVRAEAHAIKGGCGMVGAVELARIAASVEAGSHTESPFTIFAAACARLQSMLDARL